LSSSRPEASSGCSRRAARAGRVRRRRSRAPARPRRVAARPRRQPPAVSATLVCAPGLSRLTMIEASPQHGLHSQLLARYATTSTALGVTVETSTARPLSRRSSGLHGAELRLGTNSGAAAAPTMRSRRAVADRLTRASKRAPRRCRSRDRAGAGPSVQIASGLDERRACRPTVSSLLLPRGAPRLLRRHEEKEDHMT
jgi:hypothetical protein